jgi:Skp family chaperone for outer membrane proteins
VKRTVIGVAVGVVTLGLAIYVGSRLSAQQPGTPAPKPAGGSKSRIVLLNLKYVVTNYEKWKYFQEQYKSDYKGYEDRAKALTATLDAIDAALKDPKVEQATKDAKTKERRNVQVQMADLEEEAKKTLGKKESDMLVNIYQEVAAAVHAYAQANDIDFVLHYNDATTPEEMVAAPNIHRKMGSGPCVPLYWKPEGEISQTVLLMLNQKYTGPRAAPTTPAATPATGGAPAGGQPPK